MKCKKCSEVLISSSTCTKCGFNEFEDKKNIDYADLNNQVEIDYKKTKKLAKSAIILTLVYLIDYYLLMCIIGSSFNHKIFGSEIVINILKMFGELTQLILVMVLSLIFISIYLVPFIFLIFSLVELVSALKKNKLLEQNDKIGTIILLNFVILGSSIAVYYFLFVLS